MYLLLKLVNEHPMMREVASKEVRQLLVRSDVTIKTVYHGVLFLNQLEFVDGENDFVVSLISFYFQLFKKYASLTLEGKKKKRVKNRKNRENREEKKDEGDNNEVRLKVISALLTGINRAMPYGKGEYEGWV